MLPKNDYPMLSRPWCLYEMLIVEGGAKFTDHENDSGGATKYGVTEAEARAYGYEGDMADLPLEVALDIGGKRFWDRMKCDDLQSRSMTLAWIVYSSGYHSGYKTPIIWLQEFLNCANYFGKYWPDQKVDGLNGKNTLLALDAYLKKRGNVGLRNLLDYMLGRMTTKYTELAKAREKDEEWYYGWLERARHLRDDAMEFRPELFGG